MRPLEGLKVLDFFWVAVGPMTTGYLAEYGATVVRVESRRRPDPLRSSPPFREARPGPNRSGYYASYNAGKRALGLNMGHPKAIEVVKRLVAWADVVAENFTPGTMQRWGLGYDELVKIKPDIIMLSTSMFGHGGPLSSQPGYGPVLSSLSGMTGRPSTLPCRSGCATSEPRDLGMARTRPRRSPGGTSPSSRMPAICGQRRRMGTHRSAIAATATTVRRACASANAKSAAMQRHAIGSRRSGTRGKRNGGSACHITE